jgi:hypothetical protein
MSDKRKMTISPAAKGATTKAIMQAKLTEKSPLAARLKLRASHGAKTAALRKEPVLTIKGVTNPRYREFHPADHGSLEIPDYQRPIQPSMVNDILRALQAGGIVVDPITVSRRTWSGARPGKYYIVDGQQRALAHIEAGKTIKAVMYDVESQDAERQLFVVLNTQKTVNANNIVGASGSKIAIKLREFDTNPKHPLFNRVYYSQGTARGMHNMAASVLLRGLSVALGLSARHSSLPVQKLMPALDAAYNEDKVDTYFSLLAQITPAGKYGLRLLVAIAMGKVFAEKAEQYGHIVVPSNASMQSLKRVNWEKATMGSWALKFLPMIVDQIRDRWKA